MDPMDGLLGELPLPAYISNEDVGFAVRAIIVHAAESWPDGPRCRNDQAPYPCRLHRWGRRVIAKRGLSEAEVNKLIAEQNPRESWR